MLPALARRAIETYSDRGDLVVDPMCGIGTTIVEAVDIGPGRLLAVYRGRLRPVDPDSRFAAIAHAGHGALLAPRRMDGLA
jgi:modification methylase